MALLDGVGVLVLACCLALLALVGRRRLLASRGARIEMSVRAEGASPRWTYGVARYSTDALHWFRVFSLALRPRRTIRRSGLRVRSQRPPDAHERHSVAAGSVVLSCEGPAGPVELALSVEEVPGFLAWLEGAPPDPRNVA